jgi:hypothetical protein
MSFARIVASLANGDPFDVLLQLAEKFSDLPRDSWGYPQGDLDLAQQAMPILPRGAPARCCLPRSHGGMRQ